MVEVPVKIYITNLLKTAREATRPLALLSSVTKTKALLAMADRLMVDEEVILEANRQDVEAVGKNLVGETNKKTGEEAGGSVRLTYEALRGMGGRVRGGGQLPDPGGGGNQILERPDGMGGSPGRVA